jgi:type II secretory pathway pseudopilin PulG
MKNKLPLILAGGIIFILIVTLTPLIFRGNSGNADEAKVETLNSLSNVLELYYFDHAEYPESLDQLSIYDNKKARYISAVPFITSPKNPDINAIKYQPIPNAKPYTGYNLSIELSNKKYPGSEKGVFTIKNKQ